MRKEIEGLNHDTDLYRYHGDSTVYCCRKSGLSVHMPRDSKPDKADRGENCAETEDSGGLEPDHERDRD